MIMKFLISEEEKSRILNMHQNATSRQYLTEADAPADPSWLTAAKDVLATENANGQFLSNGILKVGAAYTQPSNTWAKQVYGSSSMKTFAVYAKGSKWSASPSLTVMYCPCTVYDTSQFGGTEFDFETLNNANSLQQLISGTFKYNGKTVSGLKSNVVWYPSLPDTLVTVGGKMLGMSDETQGRSMADTLTHAEGQPYGPGAGTKYYPGGK